MCENLMRARFLCRFPNRKLLFVVLTLTLVHQPLKISA